MKKSFLVLALILSSTAFAAPKKITEVPVACANPDQVRPSITQLIQQENELLGLIQKTSWITAQNIDLEWTYLDIQNNRETLYGGDFSFQNKPNKPCVVNQTQADNIQQMNTFLSQIITNINTVNEMAPNIQKEANCANESACNQALSQKFETLSKPAKQTFLTTIKNPLTCFQHKNEFSAGAAAFDKANATFDVLKKENTWANSISISNERKEITPVSYSYWNTHLNNPTLNTPYFLFSCSNWETTYFLNTKTTQDLNQKIDTIQSVLTNKEQILKTTGCANTTACDAALLQSYYQTQRTLNKSPKE